MREYERKKNFAYEHLQNEKMRNISKQFHDLSQWIVDNLPENAERSVALRKLLEGKDCAVRAEIHGVIPRDGT